MPDDDPVLGECHAARLFQCAKRVPPRRALAVEPSDAITAIAQHPNRNSLRSSDLPVFGARLLPSIAICRNQYTAGADGAPASPRRLPAAVANSADTRHATPSAVSLPEASVDAPVVGPGIGAHIGLRILLQQRRGCLSTRCIERRKRGRPEKQHPHSLFLLPPLDGFAAFSGGSWSSCKSAPCAIC